MSKIKNVKAQAQNVKSESKKTVATEKRDVFVMQAQHASEKKIITRTDAIAQVLIDAFARSEALKTSEIVERARKLLGAEHEAYEKLDRTINSHLYTLQGANGRIGRESVIERVDGRWRLNASGAALLNLKASKKRKAK